MKKRMLMLVAPALLLAGSTAAVASARDPGDERAEAAAEIAEKATKALGKRKMGDAVALAERAVALAPKDAGHRALLGQAYLRVGRFTSAREMLDEALRLDPRKGRVALNLALAQIATGDWAMARRTLDANADKIGASDLGLAVALAGDPAGAVTLLTYAARQPGATAKTRQNLALALALSGQWQAAKVVASADTPAGDLDERLMDWATFAQPRAASDQVARLLGVTAAADAGRPATLALRDAPAPAVATAAASVPVQVAAEEPAPAVAAASPAAVAEVPPEAAVQATPAKITFAPRREIVQALPVSTIRPAAAAKKIISARVSGPVPLASKRGPPHSAAAPVKGGYFVQLGAFDSPAVARDAWRRATRRYAALKAHAPTGVDVTTGGGRFHRLSIGGFARADADAICRRYRARGGACFVRAGAGDKLAQWMHPGARPAARAYISRAAFQRRKGRPWTGRPSKGVLPA